MWLCLDIVIIRDHQDRFLPAEPRLLDNDNVTGKFVSTRCGREVSLIYRPSGAGDDLCSAVSDTEGSGPHSKGSLKFITEGEHDKLFYIHSHVQAAAGCRNDKMLVTIRRRRRNL